MDRWRELEEAATSLFTYQVLYVPGIFQTPEYAHEVFKESGRQFDDIDYQVKERIDRQKMVAPEHGTMIVAIMDEVILERPVGSREIMHAQMVKLLELAQQPNVRIQFVQLDKGAYSGLSGGFEIATVDGREYAYVDDAFSGDVLENPEEVAVIKRLWATLGGKALPTDQSMSACPRWRAYYSCQKPRTRVRWMRTGTENLSANFTASPNRASMASPYFSSHAGLSGTAG